MKIPIICDYCGNPSTKLKYSITRYKNHFCSNTCASMFHRNKIEVECKFCGNKFLKFANQLKKHPNSFCNKSCAAKYNNTHKTHGSSRSKLEVWLENELITLYPTLDFHFNRKDAINSELDIYIPSLKLAFELNGIFHFEPIFSESGLKRTKENDSKKFKLCHDNGISLCVIDTSKQKYFKEQTSLQYLKIITDIINMKV